MPVKQTTDYQILNSNSIINLSYLASRIGHWVFENEQGRLFIFKLNYLFMPKLIFSILILMALSFSGYCQSTLSLAVAKVKWKSTKIAHGLKWKRFQSNRLFNTNQSINLLEVKRKRSLSIAYDSIALIPTSQFGQKEKALAAVNAGFFNMKEGGSVTFLKVDDRVINQNISASETITQSCVTIGEEGKLTIESSIPPSYYEDPAHYDDVLFTGPLLIKNGKIQPLPDKPFNSKRHPRTCACITQNQKTLLITVDGRNEAASRYVSF